MKPRGCTLCGEQKGIRTRYQKGKYSIVQCTACTLVYTNEVPSRAELDEIYSASFFAVGEKFAREPRSAAFVNAQERVQRILALRDIGSGKWLDVGCATGDFIVAAAPFVEDIGGIEVSRYAVEQARARGAPNVMEGDFLDVRLDREAFDLVCMWDFIEHVRDPLANVRKAFQTLKPGGYLALSTGDIDSRAARFMGRVWHLMIPPRHLYFFSPATITRLLAAVGFSAVSITRPGKRVPLDFVAWKLANLFLPRASQWALRVSKILGVGKLAPFVNLFDIMTVYSRKPLPGRVGSR